jgi:hypothetical protein
MAHRGSRGIALPFMTTALEGGERSASCPDHFLPLGKTQYPLYRKLGGPQGRSGQVRKISPPPGFNPWTIQPVASRYATQPVITTSTSKNFYITVYWLLHHTVTYVVISVSGYLLPLPPQPLVQKHAHMQSSYT